MDATTSLALRAIICGLRRSGAIGESEIEGIAAALHDAEEAERGQRHGCVAYDLMRLAAEIRHDCGEAALAGEGRPAASAAG
jgi:hypothetical protein